MFLCIPLRTHTVHWGMNPPFKNTPLLFFIKAPLIRQTFHCPLFIENSSYISIYWFFVTPPPLKIRFFSEVP